jgi:uncharacterized DUF497 family protein
MLLHYFLDEYRIESIDHRKNYGEERRISIGSIEGKIYTVVYTLRKNTYQLIFARRTNRHEREAYEIYTQKKY